MIVGKTVIAIETIIVTQLAFETLLNMEFILDEWSGLAYYGKYLYSVNINAWSNLDNVDSLQPLYLDTNIFHTLNISLFNYLVFFMIYIIWNAIRLNQKNDDNNDKKPTSYNFDELDNNNSEFRISNQLPE
jgi:hypothetical protein